MWKRGPTSHHLYIKEDGLVGKHVTKYTAQLYDAFGVYYAVLAERAAAVASPAAAAAAADWAAAAAAAWAAAWAAAAW